MTPIIDEPGLRTTATPRWRWPIVLLMLAATYYAVGVLTLATHRAGETAPILYARLLATGHMGEFVRTTEQRLPPTDTWVRAATWQRMYEPEDRWVFKRIAQDTGQYEAHPPFFFWLMHVAMNLGVQPKYAPTVFNLPAALLTGGLIVAFTWRVCRSPWAAAMAGTAWFLSPPVMLIGDAVRSPTLFAPLTLLLLWQTIDWVCRPKGKVAPRVAGTIALAVLGMLNHFQMATPLAVCGLFLMMKNRRAAVIYGLSVIVAAGLFIAIDPYVFGSLKVNADVNASEPATVGHFVLRVVHVLVGLLHFFAIEPKWTRYVTLAVPLTIAAYWIWDRVRRGRHEVAGRWQAETLALSGLLIGIDVLLYVTFLVPGHAYGAYYFPGLIVLTPVWLGVALWRVVRRPAAGAFVLGMMAIASVGAMTYQLGLYRAARAASDTIAAADVIVTDLPTVQGIPRLLDPARPDAWVMAGTRQRLAEDADPAIRTGRRVIIAVDQGYGRVIPRDGLDDYLEKAVSEGRLTPVRGLEPFSPDFRLYRTTQTDFD